MAGSDISSTISLQMQSDTKNAQADLQKVADSFRELTKQVQQINVSLVGLTPATNDFIKNLQSSAKAAADSKGELTSFVGVDVAGSLGKSSVAVQGLGTAFDDATVSASQAHQGLKDAGDGALTVVGDVDQLRRGLGGATSEMDSFKQVIAEMVAAQREQTAVMRELALSMETMRQTGVKVDSSNKGWIATIKDWAMAGYFLVAGYNQVNTALDDHRAKATDAAKAAQDSGNAAQDAGQKYGAWAGDIDTVVGKLSNFNQSVEESKKQIESLQATLTAADAQFFNSANGWADAMEQALSRISQRVRDYIQQNNQDTQKDVSTWETWSKAVKDQWDKAKQAWDDYIYSISADAINYPTRMKALTQAETDFLQEHLATWDKIKAVTDDYMEKFGTEMPENMRKAYLDMRTGVQPEIFKMIDMAAAAGTSFKQLADDLEQQFGAKLAGNLGATFARISKDMNGTLADAASNIRAVVPLQEQLSKAGNVEAEQKVAIWKQYTADLAEQTKATKEAALALSGLTQENLDEAKSKLEAAKAAQTKANTDLEAAKAIDANSKATKDAKVEYDKASASVKEMQGQYDGLNKKISDGAEAIRKDVQARADAIKKTGDSLTSLATTLTSTLGKSKLEVMDLLAEALQADARFDAAFAKVNPEIEAQEKAMLAFRKAVVQGTITTKDELLKEIFDMSTLLDQSEANTVKVAADRVKAAQNDMKQIADAQQKAIQDSIKNMEVTVTQGFATLKQQSAEAFKSVNKDIADNEQAWRDSQKTFKDAYEEQELAWDKYVTDWKKRITDMSSDTTTKFAEIRAAIQNATNAGDLKTVDALKKGLADFAQSSITQYQAWADKVKTTYQGLKDQHAALIEQMDQKEQAWAKQRIATEDYTDNALRSIQDRGLTSYQKYQATIERISQRKIQIDQLIAQGDQVSLDRAEELYKRNITDAQSLQAVKMSVYDQMSQADRAYVDAQIEGLNNIQNKTVEQEAQLKRLNGLKQGGATFITTEKAQQDAYNIALDASVGLKKLEADRQDALRQDDQARLQSLQDQTAEAKDMLTTLQGIIGAAKQQVDFALDTNKAEQKIQALMQARTMQVDFDMSASKSLLDQILAPRTMQVKFDFSNAGAFKVEPIATFAGGGFLPGYGGGDRRLILAEDGEYIFNKDAVRAIGVGVLDQWNKAGVGSRAWASPSAQVVYQSLLTSQPNVPKFQSGGLVNYSNAQTQAQAQYLAVYNKTLADAVGAVVDEIDLDAKMDKIAKSVTEEYQKTLDSTKSIDEKRQVAFDASVSKLENTLNTPFNITIRVMDDGMATAMTGTWD